MSSAPSQRSNLVDVTYQELHVFLSNHLEGTTETHIGKLLRPRLEQLSNLAEPFGKPNDASKKKIESGSVSLRDNVVLKVEDVDKEFVFAISDAFQIDQVEALVLLRSFLYNEGLPPDASAIDDLVESITTFYYSERLSLLRTLIPLYRAKDEPEAPESELAEEFLPLIVSSGSAFVESLLNEYIRKTSEPIPARFATDPRKGARWAKQNLKEQLIMLEVLFWTMWNHVSCTGTLVIRVFETAYATGLGSNQENATMLLDDEAAQLKQDAAAVWIIIMLEILELERLADPGPERLTLVTEDDSLYATSPDSLTKLHELILSNQDSQYACIILAWAFVLSRLTTLRAEISGVSPAFQKFFDALQPHTDRRFAPGVEPIHLVMSRSCLDPDIGLLSLMHTLLTSSPLFVSSVAFKTGSCITDPNAVAFRSVFKGLIIALLELVPAETIPDFDSLVEVWIALFGRSERASVIGICNQFWKDDYQAAPGRRALLEVATTRFPVQPRPLIRLLRALTGAGFLDTDELATPDPTNLSTLEPDRHRCNQNVLLYLSKLSTYTQVIPANASHGLYDRVIERQRSGFTYTNTRPIRLPGGSMLPARSTGRLLSGDGGEYIAVLWRHSHSGWKILLEILTDYVQRKRGTGSFGDISFGRRTTTQAHTLRLEDVGVELGQEGDDVLVTDTLDLVRSVIQDDPASAEHLLEIMETGDPVNAHTMLDTQPPDLVQLTTTILEEALSRPAIRGKTASPTALITSAISVLSSLVTLPKYSSRVWLFIRSTTALFGSDKAIGFTSSVLAAERSTGSYTMTLSFLHLVQQLFLEASSMVLSTSSVNPRLQQVKEEVLLRALRFVHTEIWVEHTGWKYAQLGDRFEIGRRVSALYAEVLTHASPTIEDAPFASVGRAAADVLLYKATSSSISPLIIAVSSAFAMYKTLSARRISDARRLIFMVEAHLTLIRIVLNIKQRVAEEQGPCLLEQTLCSHAQANSGGRARRDHIDVLAAYVNERGVGSVVPLEATWILQALCSSLPKSQPSPPTIAGHLANSKATVASLVRIVQHPYDDPELRNAIWDFMAVAVDHEPALAGLLVAGQFRIPDTKAKDKAPESTTTLPSSAFDVAVGMLTEWKQLWEYNPHSLASILSFLDTIWEHGLEHRAALEIKSKDVKFWSYLAGVVLAELGPVPDYRPQLFEDIDGTRHSLLHDAVSAYAYRTKAKAYALHIIGLDIQLQHQLHPPASTEAALEKTQSYLAVEPMFKTEEQLTDHIAEAMTNAFNPELHDEYTIKISDAYPALALPKLQSFESIAQREFGDGFVFSIPLLERRLQPHRVSGDPLAELADELERQIVAINLNLSLAHAHTALVKSWQFLLRPVIPYLRGDQPVRRSMLALTASVSSDLAGEKRPGDMMSAIHGERLSLLLALLEVIWFSTSDKADEIKRFISLVKNVHGIVLNTVQDPLSCVLGKTKVPFHRTLLQIIFFCVRHGRSLVLQPKTLNAESRLELASTIDVCLGFVINSLRIVFDAARGRSDLDLDQDMELLVAVFEQCTHLDVNPSTVTWLARCQETDVIRASFELFVRLDHVGLAHYALLQRRGQPLYSPHVLAFHTALASIPSSAERLASEGILSAYTNNSLTEGIRRGAIDIALPELPNALNPAHKAYCTMLAVISSVLFAMGQQYHFLDQETSGFVLLYSDQLTRALSWTIGDSINLALLEEIEQVANLFYAVSESTTVPSLTTTQVLRMFSSHALRLLQQLNYALTHPNHLGSLVDPVTNDERILLERDSRAADGQSVASSEFVDPTKRPFLASLIHRLFGLTSAILSTLISISKAEVVLLGELEDWPLHEALIVPHSKVILGEPASMGTLLELINGTLDVLRRLTGQPAPLQAITPVGVRGEKPLDVKDSIIATRRTLETAALYSAAQLALWVARPDTGDEGGVSGEVEMDEPSSDISLGPSHDARKAPTSFSLAERLRRGMTGEIASDLISALNKARPILTKADSMVGDKVDGELMVLLAGFIKERVAASEA